MKKNYKGVGMGVFIDMPDQEDQQAAEAPKTEAHEDPGEDPAKGPAKDPAPVRRKADRIKAPEHKSVRMQILITPTHKARLREEAERTGTSENAIINKLLAKRYK